MRNESDPTPRAARPASPGRSGRLSRPASPSGPVALARAGAALLLLVACASSDADGLRITEAVVDPQQDHSESRGGNGTPFDTTSGSGTISSVDEYVEIYNAGTGNFDLTGFSLSMDDTTPATFRFSSPGSAVLRFTPGSRLHALLPGGLVLVGNPAGALNNTIDLALWDATGARVDAFPIADGNAAGVADEAVHRAWTGSRFLDRATRGTISPLALPEASVPVPEPTSLALFGISLLAGAAASVRRARRARRRSAAAAPAPR